MRDVALITDLRSGPVRSRRGEWPPVVGHRVAMVGHCLGIDHATAFWPHGTEVVSKYSLTIDVPGIGKVSVGDQLSGGADVYTEGRTDDHNSTAHAGMTGRIGLVVVGVAPVS